MEMTPRFTGERESPTRGPFVLRRCSRPAALLGRETGSGMPKSLLCELDFAPTTMF